MISRLAVWYLRKRKRSVIIGFRTQGGSVQPKNRKAFFYDSEFIFTTIFNQNGKEMNLPRGKFNYEEDHH